MTLGCPVGHPSGAGKHCPLCGRAYVRLEDVQAPDPYVYALPAPRHAEPEPVAEAHVEAHVEVLPAALPAPRHAMDEDVVVPDIVDDGFRPEVEALAMLSSLASDFDY